MKHLLPTLLLSSLLLLPSAALCEENTAEPAVIEVQAGTESAAVQSAQSKLTELGYYTGTVTGRCGEKTVASIRAFEADFGLTEDGQLDSDELQILLASTYRPLTYGSSGEDVKRLQTRLTDLGYYKGRISGNYLESTQAAVKDFQQKMGTVMSGDADLSTQELLYSKDARTQKQSALKGATTPEPMEVLNVPDGSDDETGEPAVTPSPTAAFGKTLKKGSSGDQVKKVQQRLTDLLYYTGPISGSYQDKTVSAMKRFQKQNGLPSNGITDQATWDALFNSDALVLPDATARPTPEPTPVPDPAFHIVVDVNNQVVTVYGRDADGEYTQVVRQMICSTGTKKNPSSLGDWVLNGRHATWCYFPAWGDYARYWTRINSSIAFHSVIYAKVNTMSLSVKSYKALGSRASHGCIRLLVSDAKWIYDNVGAGTVVTITQDLPADPELKASVKQPALNYSNMLPVETPKPTAEPVYVSGAVPPLPLAKMQKKDSSPSVWWLQKKLTELGYYHGKCSGTFLDGTMDAVKAFQKDHGLKVTGVADVNTLQVIYQDELATSSQTVSPLANHTIVPLATPAAPTPSPAHQ